MKGIYSKLALMGALLGGFEPPQMREIKSMGANINNPHGFDRFETDGFVTYSINQESHNAKYAKYCKKKGIDPKHPN